MSISNGWSSSSIISDVLPEEEFEEVEEGKSMSFCYIFSSFPFGRFMLYALKNSVHYCFIFLLEKNSIWILKESF